MTGGRRRDPGRERKVATLLFADIVDFTSMGEAHDPELVSSIVRGTFERLSKEVHRYEGTIEKFAGDALLAVFGVPAAHEDDPERAVRAALEMQAVMSERRPVSTDEPAVALRIGIETGEVLVDRTRAVAERDLFVTGDAVNIAARLQTAAAPGAVVVGPRTRGTTGHVVEYQELPALDLKGKSVPFVAWRAVALKTRRGGGRAPLSLETPLVGRDAELALLKDTIRRAADEGRPHLVTVIGSAGAGKSRLSWELEKYLDGLSQTYHWRKGRCLAYAGPSFGPIAEVVKVDAHISDDDPPEAAREKLRMRLSELPVGDDASDILDILEAVLGTGDPRERSRGELFEGWRRYLRSIARVEPLVFVVEDIHWADDGVLSFLDYLARWGEGPIVILCLARHELLEIRPGWGGGLPDATTIILEPLAAEASARLMDGLLTGGVPHQLRDRVIDRADGNPLFAEEMVRMLVDSGALRFADGSWQLARPVDEIEIPESVRAVLAARLDSLPEQEKRTAQYAAVAGRVFWDVLIAQLAGDDLGPTDERIRRLRVKDLVVSREPSALAGAAEYGFRHVLTRDVAYDSLPKRDRAGLHRDIAAWVEERLADRIDEFSELVATHLRAALTYEADFVLEESEDLRVLRRLTLTATLRAARRASSLDQIARACDWMRTAIELARELHLPAREIALLVDEDAQIHGTLAFHGDHAAAVSAVVDGLTGLPHPTDEDKQLLARLESAHGEALYAAGDVAGARAALRHGLHELEAGPPTAGRARLYRTLGWTYWRAGPFDEAIPPLELALAEAQASHDAETLRWAKHDLGVAHDYLGRHALGIELMEESYRLARESSDRALVDRCRTNLPRARFERGDALESLATMTEEGLHESRRAGESVATPAYNLATYMMEMGRLEEALAYQDEAVASVAARGPAGGTWLLNRAVIHRLRDDTSAAESDESAAAALGTIVEPQNAAEMLLAHGWAGWSHDPATALGELATALEEKGLLPEILWLDVAQAVARMALRLGDRSRLERAVEQHRRSRWPGTPVLDAQDRWVDGLLADNAGLAIEGAAAQLADLGYIRRALDAWTDAALMAARAGRLSVAQDRAMALATSTGIHPLLGPLPETRWLRAAEATTSS